MPRVEEDVVPGGPEPQSPVVSGGAAEIAFRRIARRKLIERGFDDEAAIEAKIAELLHKGLPIDPNVLTE